MPGTLTGGVFPPATPDEILIATRLDCDLPAARELLHRVHSKRPSATGAEVVRAAIVLVQRVHPRNQVGLWMVALPKMAAAAEWERIRAEVVREGLQSEEE